jgi:uridine kinase
LFTVNVSGVEVKTNGTYLDALKLAGKDEGALAIRHGGETCELNWDVIKDCTIEPLTLSTDEGRRVYERSLIFLLLMAVKDEYPHAKVEVEHSLPQGLYIQLKEIKFLSNSIVARIERRMKELAEQDLPFTRDVVSLAEAIEIFREQGQDDKVRLLSYRPKDSFRIYTCGNVRDYFYGEMVPSTGYMKLFSLNLHLPGIVLTMPSRDNPQVLSQREPSPKLAEVFAQSEKWGEILNVQVVADLNDMIKTGDIHEFVRVNEALHEKTISQIADEIYEKKPHVVLIAGPSSSGKTTFTNRLNIQLRVNGLKPILISLDNYYKSRSDVPLDENGNKDFEHLHSIDVAHFNEQLVSLLQGDTVHLPVFDFGTGKRSERGVETKLLDNQPILIEGIHGLNDDLTYDIPREFKYKVFVSALNQLNLDDSNRIRSTDLRLIRRLTRDYFTRSSTMTNTFSMWPSVRKGEERWIFPFQEEADYIFNSSLTYELAVIKKYLYPLLSNVEPSSEYYLEARRLVKFLNYILDADVERDIPPTSILREFIGGNSFYS